MHQTVGIVFGYFLFVLIMVIHEVAHLREMLRNGIKVEELGIGIPIGKTLQIRITHPKLPCLITINPLLIGAYVRPSEEEMDKILALPYCEQAVIHGNGIWANIVYSGLMFLVLALAQNHYSTGTIYVCMGLILVFPRKFFCCYLLPVLGLGVIVFLVYSVNSIFHRLPSTEALQQIAGGPVTALHIIAQYSGAIINALYFSAALSFCMALMNSLPLYPLDGGRIMNALIKGLSVKAAKIYRDATIMVFLAIIGLTFAVDIWKYIISAFKPLWQ